jgi:hypothetical protein
VRVVCVHGTGKQLDGEQTLLNQWRPALHDGLARVDASVVTTADLSPGTRYR